MIGTCIGRNKIYKKLNVIFGGIVKRKTMIGKQSKNIQFPKTTYFPGPIPYVVKEDNLGEKKGGVLIQG